MPSPWSTPWSRIRAACRQALLLLVTGLGLIGLIGLGGSRALANTATATACPPAPAGAAADRSAAATPARDRGLLWRISRDGRTSWIYGTLHVGKPAWKRFGPQLTAALHAADVLALEIDPADPALIAALAEIQPPAELPAELQQRLARAYARACVAPEALASLHPLLQATTLIVLEARWLGMDPLHALEQTLAARTRSRGKPVVALETAAQQKAALVPDDKAEALSLLEQSLAQLEDGSGRRVLSRMVQAWEDGDLAALEDYERWCECAGSDTERQFMKKLNDDRNPVLADGIEAQHAAGKRVFAAVGALHMTGPMALPRLLQQRGFKVERVTFAR